MATTTSIRAFKKGCAFLLEDTPAEEIFTREQLMVAAYDGKVHVSDRTIDSHIRNIRAKCANLACGNVIETVHGIGFRLGACKVER